jgi:hypothetical protein
MEGHGSCREESICRPPRPGLPRALREADPGFVPLDGTLTEGDRAGDGPVDYIAAAALVPERQR